MALAVVLGASGCCGSIPLCSCKLGSLVATILHLVVIPRVLGAGAVDANIELAVDHGVYDAD